ncbi:phosphoribosyltransferase domain-containing protein [Arthrobacter sp. TMN-49]
MNTSTTDPARPEPAWGGGFVAEQLNVHIHSDPASAVAVQDLVGLALRRNPKRAHLLVSTVLAKHIPTEPALVIAAGELLGAFVAKQLSRLTYDAGDRLAMPVDAWPDQTLADAAAQLTAVLHSPAGHRQEAITALAGQFAGMRTQRPGTVVLGYAETATGLGRLVANALGAYYIHSTRHATPGIQSAAGFEEGHSHATSHNLVPTDPHWFDGAGPVILVDDELSTGSTVINTIRELHALIPHPVYVVAALIDLRSDADRARFEALAQQLGCRIAVAALGTGRVELEDGILEQAADLMATLPQPVAPEVKAGRLSMLELSAWDVDPVRSDRFGNASSPSEATIALVAGQVAEHLSGQDLHGPVVVVGTEENMFLPLAVADVLAAMLPGIAVRFSTTTRSPIVPLERDDYAIAGALTFASHDLTLDGPGVRFAYNLNGAGQRPGTIVVFPEPGTNRHAVLHGDPASGLPPLAGALQAAADDVVVVLLPVDAPSPTSTEDQI